MIKKTFDLTDDLLEAQARNNRSLVKNEEMPGVGFATCFKVSTFDDYNGPAILKYEDLSVKACILLHS